MIFLILPTTRNPQWVNNKTGTYGHLAGQKQEVRMSSIKIKDFFNGRFFEIPKYQRGYAWDVQNVRDLFDDLTESIESNSNHYIGTIVLSKDKFDDEKYHVVDGQQRITTITMIIKSLVSKLCINDKLYYERFYLKEGERVRLTPLNRDREFFTNLMLDFPFEPKSKSQRALSAAISEIEIRTSNITDKLAFLKCVEKLEVMEFVENSEGDAIRIFQTVNDRGKLLSNMEKAKSLLIYFSNRYLNKKLDDEINDQFSTMFEIYDDIKIVGEQINVALIKNKEFDEDSIMRYHFVSFSNENYDPTAAYVLKYLKTRLTNLRAGANGDYSQIEIFIENYVKSLRMFFHSLLSLLNRANQHPKYYKLFSILQITATLYPLIVKMENMELLDKPIPSFAKKTTSFLDLLELVDVRVYKTRGTDPKADLAKFTFEVENKTPREIESWLLWFNNRWMSKDEFQSALTTNIFGNRALNHIFINYCEAMSGVLFSIDELKDISALNPNIEHILSQTPNFDPTAFGFTDEEDYINHEHRIGNLSILERNYNSSVQNKAAIDKVDTYDRSCFFIMKEVSSHIYSKGGFDKADILERTKKLSEYCTSRWWSETRYLPTNEDLANETITV